MNCEDFELYGSAYIDNMISSEERLEFENHINECECCNIKFQNLKLIIESTNEIEEVELPINFSSELKVKLEKANKSKSIIFNKKKMLSFIVAGLFIIITSVSILNNSTIYENQDNLNSEIYQMSESQESIRFDIASDQSTEKLDIVQQKNGEGPRIVAIENIDEGQELSVEDSSKETNEENTYNIMTENNNEDSLYDENLQRQSTYNMYDKSKNFFGLLVFILGVGTLIYIKFRK